MTVIPQDGTVVESDEDEPGVIVDCAAHGDLLSLENLDAARRVTDTRTIELQTTE